jgi:hypothetical protein
LAILKFTYQQKTSSAMTISSIARDFGHAKFIQVGFDGDWENCLSIPIGGALSPQDIKAIRSYSGNNVAFEVFYAHPSGESFVGIRPVIKNYDAALTENFLSDLVQTPDLSVSVAAEMLHKAFNCPRPLFTAQPAHVEMGVVNLWNSFGQIVIWEGRGDAYDLRPLAANDASRYLQPQPMPLGLEVAFSNPHHWIAIPVSKPTPSGHHQLDLQAYSQALIALNLSATA